MTEVASWAGVLPEGTRAVALARRTVRLILTEARAGHFAEAAALATSELVTNALVHAGQPVSLSVWASARGVRVEVSDSSPHLPVERSYSVMSATGLPCSRGAGGGCWGMRAIQPCGSAGREAG